MEPHFHTQLRDENLQNIHENVHPVDREQQSNDVLLITTIDIYFMFRLHQKLNSWKTCDSSACQLVCQAGLPIG